MPYNVFHVSHALANVHSLNVPELFFFLSSGMYLSSLLFSFITPFMHSILFSGIHSFVSSLLYSFHLPVAVHISFIQESCYVHSVSWYLAILHLLVHIFLYFLLFHSNHLYLLCIIIYILFVSSACYKSIYLTCIRIFPLLYIYIFVFPLQ